MRAKDCDIAARITGFIAVLLLGGSIAIQTPTVQQKLAGKAVAALNRTFGADISFSSLEIKPFNIFEVKDFLMLDKDPYKEDRYKRGWAPADTFIYSRIVRGTVNPAGLFRGEGLHLGRVTLEDAVYHIVSEPDREAGSNLARIFGGGEKTEKSKGGPNIFDIRQIYVRNFRFKLNNFRPAHSEKQKWGILYEDMDIFCNELKAHGLKFTGGRISFAVDRMDAREKSGYCASLIRGKAKIGNGRTTVTNFHLIDPWSDFKFSEYSMIYDDAKAFGDYLNRVRMELRMKKCRLGMKTVSYFSGIIPDNTLDLEIEEGSFVSGYVSDLDVKDLRFHETTSGVSGTVSAHATGIPLKEISGFADIRSLSFTTDGLSRFLSAISPSIKVDTGGLAPGVRFSFTGSGSGSLNRFSASGRLSSAIGGASASLNVRNLADKARATEVVAKVSADGLDAGKIAGIDILGPCSLEGGARAVLSKGSTSVIIDSVRINEFSALGYKYSGLDVSGKLKDGVFDGQLVSTDPNLEAAVSGLFSLSPGKDGSAYRFTADIRKANLDSLGIDRSGRGIKASGIVDADIVNIPGSGLEGSASVRNILLSDNADIHDLGDIYLESHTYAGMTTATLSSLFADGYYEGSIPIASLPSAIQELTTVRHLGALYPKDKRTFSAEAGDCSASLEFHDCRELLSFIKPGLYIADSTRVGLRIDRTGELAATLRSSRLALGKNFIKDATADIDNLGESLNASLCGSLLKAGPTSIEDPAVTAYAKDNSAYLGVHCTDANDPDNYGEFYMNADISRTEGDSLVVSATPLPSYFRFGEDEWKTGESNIVLKKGSVSIDRFIVENGTQSILVHGGVSEDRTDTLKLAINGKSLDFLNILTDNCKDVSGILNGVASLYSPTSEGLRLMADLTCSDTEIGKEDLGETRLLGAWDNDAKKFNVWVRNTTESKIALLANGWFKPDDGSISLKARMNSFKLAAAEPFLKDVFSEIGGYLDGSINAEGNLNSPSISSENLILEDARLKVAFTGVPYTINGPVRIDGTGIILENASIRDDKDGRGTISGGLKFENLMRGVRIDAALSASGLSAVEITEESNQGFYGNVSADIDVTVKGPFSDITIDGSVATSGTGDINIPINSAVAQKSSRLLTFTQPKKPVEDPYDEMLLSVPEKRTSTGNISINLDAAVGSETRAHVEIDKSTGNVATAYGNGNVHFDMQTASSKMNLTGVYNLDGGKYHFEIPGVIGKDFNIRNGSAIKFRGGIMDTEIDLTAVYNVKTSLAALIADTSSVSTRRNVECLINITGLLQNLKIGFGINVPNLDPTTKSRVESALNTDDKVQQQFVALLVMGSFLPGGQSSGIFNNTNILLSNVGDIMANQLNTILQQLQIPLDLGLGYQQVDGGNDVFDVAVSTQLFNNRVEVNGSVGNRQYNPTTSARTNDVVGDIDIEYKIDPAGQFRLKMFSHSADEFTSFLDYSQRNGIGITYQKGFNKLRDLFRPRKKKKDKDDAE